METQVTKYKRKIIARSEKQLGFVDRNCVNGKTIRKKVIGIFHTIEIQAQEIKIENGRHFVSPWTTITTYEKLIETQISNYLDKH